MINLSTLGSGMSDPLIMAVCEGSANEPLDTFTIRLKTVAIARAQINENLEKQDFKAARVQVRQMPEDVQEVLFNDIRKTKISSLIKENRFDEALAMAEKISDWSKAVLIGTIHQEKTDRNL